ncbi:MAG TPA: hypothetical protein VJ898_08685 [Natrialbaceae archaeon]|nr:hypothetical protein [Natrialbaceae archaeon]
MSGNPSAPGPHNPGPEHSARTVVMASVVTVLATFGLVLAVAAPVATVAGVFVLAATGRLVGRAADGVRRRQRRDGRKRRVCVPYTNVSVEL